MTTIRFVMGGNFSRKILARRLGSDWSSAALLVSYPFRSAFRRFVEAGAVYRDWALDCGAFSAHRSGNPVSLEAYTRFCVESRASDPTLAEVFALDVIGDHMASRRNTEAMWAAGVPAIPTFHFGSPRSELVSLARDYSKIALGGMVGRPRSAQRDFARYCFDAVWPKHIHAFGVGHEPTLSMFPFHSADATTWENGPRFGRWRHSPERDGWTEGERLQAEIEQYLAMEARLVARWGRTLASVGGQVAA